MHDTLISFAHSNKPLLITLFAHIGSRTTTMKVFDVSSDKLKVVHEKQYDQLMIRTIPTVDYFVTCYMKERSLDSPSELRFWSWETYEEEKSIDMSGQKFVDVAIAVSPDEKVAALGIFDEFIHLFNWDTMEVIGAIPDQFGKVECFQFSPDGETFAYIERHQGLGFIYMVRKTTNSFPYIKKLWESSLLEDVGSTQDLNFIDEDNLLLSVVNILGKVTAVKFNISSQEIAWEKTWNDALDETENPTEALTNVDLNTPYKTVVKDGQAIIGSFGSVRILDCGTGKTTKVPTKDGNQIMQIIYVTSVNKYIALNSQGEPELLTL